MRCGVTLAAAGLLASAGASAQAQSARAERVSHAVVSMEYGCPITPPLPTATLDRGGRPIGAIVGTVLAGVAGDLAASSLNAIGGALEEASKEKAFVAEGATSFDFYLVGQTAAQAWTLEPNFRVKAPRDGGPMQTTPAVEEDADSDGGADAGTAQGAGQGEARGSSPTRSGAPRGGSRADAAGSSENAARCLVLALPASASRSETQRPLTTQDLQTAFPGIAASRTANALARLQGLGLGALPAVYVEAELIAVPDGMIVHPVLVRYGAPIKGAPTGDTATELHVSFATPGGADTTDIGTLFGVARIELPRMKPGGNKSGERQTLYGREALAPYGRVVTPLRPSAGAADEALKARTGVHATIDAKRKEISQLLEVQRLAQRSLDQNQKPADRQGLQNALDDARRAVGNAQGELTKLRQAETALGPTTAGSTNVKARFVAIRDANAFGLALGKAIKGRAEAAGKDITAELAPKPAWSTEQTAYVESEIAVRAAQRALDDAIAKGETDKVPGLQDGVSKAKAQANQSAVSAGKSPPYVITF